MKKTQLLNPQLSYVVASLGHFDELTICDAGLPINDQNKRIDLALTHGVPSFIDTVRVLLTEVHIIGVLLADEFEQANPNIYHALISLLKEQQVNGHHIDIQYISHESFKTRTLQSKAVVRTGECSPYANVIFQSGVVF
ncbi:D-ribose pyranase [Psychromonas sp. Urea-02u-13]|uniref:D-ribose pyranase n=1 Tax=Psychromonas sp. Urea-02u-13 TaxID=2058326 RepID=UPI000C33D8AE|nr:D-ribose pyranase [Psychromonas sp. Urea-02u-13]PKG39748.1 D-ribose pyranase [Psychromonas sp. Urea-02u-13]